MRKTFLSKSLVAGFMLFSALGASAQTMQGSLRKGSSPRTVDIYLKPSETFSQRDESMTFVLAVPATVTPAPTLGSAGVTANTTGPVTGIAGLQPSFLEVNLGSTSREVVVSKQTIDEVPYYIYTFIFAGTANTKHNWTKGVEQKMFSIQFNGCTSECDPTKALLVNLPSGGAQGSAYWYFQSNTLGDITNYKAPFYKNEQSKTPLNGNSPNGAKLSYVGTAEQVQVAKPVIEALVEKATPTVYPTVTSGLVNVRLPRGRENATITVFSGAGEEVAANASKTLNRSINLAGLASGTYYVKILDKEKEVSTTKVVLQK